MRVSCFVKHRTSQATVRVHRRAATVTGLYRYGGRMQEVVIDNNDFSKLPDAFGSAKRLTKLSAFYNQITALPSWVRQLSEV